MQEVILVADSTKTAERYKCFRAIGISACKYERLPIVHAILAASEVYIQVIHISSKLKLLIIYSRQQAKNKLRQEVEITAILLARIKYNTFNL